MLGKMMSDALIISALIEHAERYHGDAEVVSLETSGEVSRTHWAEVALSSRKLAAALKQLGLKPGDRCATLAWNNHRHLKTYFAVPGGGYICHTLNPRLFPEQLVYIINNANDKVLFVDKTFLPLVTKIRSQVRSIQHYIYMGARDEEVVTLLGNEVLFFDELVTQGDPKYSWPKLDENSPSSLCYTSGTTGNPKGVLYSHRSTLLHTLSIALPDSLSLSAKETILPAVPMFHVNAWGIPYAAAMTGAKLVMPGSGLDGDSLLKRIDEEQVTIALGVPTIWQMLLAAAEKSGAKMASLKRNVVGGAACPPSMIKTFKEKYACETIHAWGMTETSPLGSANNLLAKHQHLSPEEQDKIRLGQGRPPFGIRLKIVDDHGKTLPNDGKTQGRLMCQGAWVVDTYFNMEQTATENGWFDTGDVATLDANGYVVIRDRSKDMIKSGGEWISSVELEGIITAHHGLANATVIAAKHARWGERPLVIAVKARGHDPSVQDILQFFEGKIAKWQIPDDVIFVESLPLNGAGKILKNQLRDTYGEYLLKSAT